MVFLHYKQTEHNQFIIETTVTETVDNTIAYLVEINNLRVILDRLAVSVEELATLGPMKPQEVRGLDSQDLMKAAVELSQPDIKRWAEQFEPQHGERKVVDQNAFRIGIVQSEEICKMMISTAADAQQAISQEKAAAQICLDSKELQKHLDNLRGAVMIAYPGYHGLGEWEPVQLILENQIDWQGRETDIADYLNPQDTCIWWAGKEFQSGKLLKDYIGQNEQTTVIIQLNQAGTGAPAREPMIDQETHQQMLSYYYQKQEEHKKLEEENEDNYLNSAWANPNNLQNQLIGSGKDISWKPK